MMHTIPGRASILTLVWLFLGACQTAPQSEKLLAGGAASLPESSMIEDLPFFPQKRYQCGPAALATVLSHKNRTISPGELEGLLYVPEKRGTFQLEILAAARAKGRVVYVLENRLENILAEVASGNPVIVFQNLGLGYWPVWHFAVVKGYSLQTARLLLNSGVTENYALDIKTFESTWRRAGYWAVVALKPGELPETAEPESYLGSVLDFKHSYGNTGDVIKAFNAALDRWPGHRLMRMGLADSYFQRGDFVNAEAELKALLAENPEYAPAHNNLAHVFLKTGEYGKARRHAEFAVAHGSRFAGEYQNTLQQISRYTTGH